VTRRALGLLTALLAVVAGTGFARAHRQVVPPIQVQAVSVLETTTTAAPATTVPPPPSTAAVAHGPRVPAPPPVPLPPAEKPLTGPFWVAAANPGADVTVYRSPGGDVQESVRNPNEAGTTRVFLVKHRVDASWVEAFMPTRPNEHTGFLRTDSVTLSTVDTQVLVEQRYHRLTAWAGDQVIYQGPVAIGKPSTPTPTGLFYLQELIRTGNPRGAYGPYVFGLSAHSNVFESFGGGDGLVGLHGTNEAGSVGRSASHGCLRLGNAAIANLASSLPVGTPIVIVG
jgi:lipoprotein-anchoring transpeptidase ErfK/SrfK